MREISEYTLLGNYLVLISDKLGQDSIKYEVAKSITEKIIAQVNKNTQSYLLLPMDKKMDIVKSMISKGVFRTDSSNRAMPFKQVYNYEVSRYIHAVYTCDGSLTFKFPKTTNEDKDYIMNAIKASYCHNLNLDLQNAIKNSLVDIKAITKTSKTKSKE